MYLLPKPKLLTSIVHSLPYTRAGLPSPSLSIIGEFTTKTVSATQSRHMYELLEPGAQMKQGTASGRQPGPRELMQCGLVAQTEIEEEVCYAWVQ